MGGATGHMTNAKSLEGTKTGSFSDFISFQDESKTERKRDPTSLSPSIDSASVIVRESTGCESIDRVLMQHLLHCEFLLQVYNQTF